MHTHMKMNMKMNMNLKMKMNMKMNIVMSLAWRAHVRGCHIMCMRVCVPGAGSHAWIGGRSGGG